jgi:hypothetical protein
MNKQSRKHHYLPVFYLKGFTDEKGKLAVYNKLKDEFIENCEPSSFFFEKDLNNVRIEGQKTLSLEDEHFMDLDSRAASFLHRYLKNEIITDEYEQAEFRFELAWFIIQLYWRIPNSNKRYKELLEKSGMSTQFFDIKSKTDGSSAPPEMLEKLQALILQNDEMGKLFKLAYPLTMGTSGELMEVMKKATDYSLTEEFAVLTGDSPFLSRIRQPSIYNMLGDFLFPAGSKALILANDAKPTFVNNLLITNLNIWIIHQSERFVCGHNIDYLKTMVSHYKMFQKHGALDSIQHDTFEHIEEMAGYETLEEFLASVKRD